ncbi:MAG: hypothetical protein D9N11_12020, partial [Ketobacter sp.]
IGCGSDSKPNNIANVEQDSIEMQQTDLSGTWLLIAETEVIKESTNEYIRTNYYQDYYVFEDTSSGVKVEYCADVGGWAPYGVKTMQHFYINVNDEGFTLGDENTLQQTVEYTDEYSPGFLFKKHTTLRRISPVQVIDFGSFDIAGTNVNVSESEHVCVARYWSSLGTTQSLHVAVPYGEGVLEFSIQYYDDLVVGVYEFEEYNDNNQILDVNVHSNDDQFWDLVGSNILAPESATIEILSINTNFISGVFSFVGQDAQEYSGSFSAELP